MTFIKILCFVLIVVICTVLVECRSYNNGLIFYNLENQQTYLPPTISVSRGRGLAKFQYSARGSIWSTFGKPCDCEGPLCGCCVGIKVKQYNFDQKMCANVTYVPRKDEIQMEVFLNDTATAKYGIAARNPSPLCVPIMMGIPMSMCVQMSNIGVQGDNLNMCMDFLVRLASTQLFEMHFQCMKVGLQGASWVGADGQPVIPANEGKIKEINSNESEEYYDESEADEENEIISKEKEQENEVMNIEEEDVNKAEEEVDYNDITEKIMDIVKEQEHEEEADAMKDSAELMKENEIEGLSPIQDNKQVEAIVTNIMESINAGKDSEEIGPSEMPNVESVQESNVLNDTKEHEETPIAVETEENDMENMESIMETNDLQDSEIKTSELSDAEESKEESESLQLEINDLKDTAVDHMEMVDSNENIKDQANLDDFSNNSLQDELHLENLFENSQDTQLQIENNVEQPQKQNNEIMKDMFVPTVASQESTMDMVEETYAETTENISDDLESANIEKFEMLINNDGAQEETTDINKMDNELNSSLEILQQPMETSTERLMAANLKPTMPQIAATTSETAGIDSIDNALTTAAIMTTKTTTKKPSVADKNSAAAITFIENTDDDDKTNNEDDEDEDNVNVDGDNSHENDSDYDDDEEESEETEDETTEKGIDTNDAFNAVVMPTTAVLKHENIINHKESSTTEQLPNASNSNESNSNDETNENTQDEFEAEEEENEDAEELAESNEQIENDAEEEYDDEFEDYETTTATVAVSDNDTCCKSAIPAVLNDMQAATIKKHDDTTNTTDIQQTNTAATSNNLQFISNTNTMISNTDSNMLNVESTTNKMSQITANPAAATIAVSTTSKSNAMPLPLARKLFALQRQQQQYQQYHHRHSRLRQHYV
ncbi:protein PFC0760c [Calliphora vicina]|uniref:protein PFC0760c n=1 Tax=Calliphora vicina TaxID=7373 RepID=UPI00325A88F4